MKLVQRGIRALLFVVLVSIPTALFAQDDAVTVAGSGVAHPLFTALADEAEIEYTLNATGNEDGFSQFCTGEATIVNVTRAITVNEESICNATGVTFVELLAGYEVLAFVSNSNLTFGQCLSTADIDALLAPTAIQNTTWSAVFPEDTDETELAVFLPQPNTITYALLDNEVNGFGFRSDARTLADDAAVLSAVAETSGALGIVRLASIPDDADVNVLEVRNNEINQCIAPDSDSISDGAYAVGTPLYSYINADATPTVNAYIQLLVSPESNTTIADAGFTAPTTLDRETNAVAATEPGRQFSRSVTEFRIPPNVTGTVTLGGAAGAFNLLNGAGTAFNQQFQNVTVNVNIEGEATGLRRLCNGEIDFAVTYAPLSDETQQNCNAIDIETLEVNVGPQVAVLVANAADEHLTCLTTDQIVSTWGAAGAELPTNWQAVDESFPDQDFILFAGNDIGNRIPNLMLQQAGAPTTPLREDTETNSDPLFRAAAVANVEGALTYMSWEDYQEVLENEQERIQLVSVDAGDGCVLPTIENIGSGEYPLARDIRFAISTTALERPEVQSFLWFVFGDQRFGEFERINMDLLTLRDMADIRETLQAAYEAADAAAIARLAAETATEEAPAPAAPETDVTAEADDTIADEEPEETEAAEPEPVETEAAEEE
ncbi:MAG: substrate-binding domain-containing protein, partial [Chloroflexota bacterium]